MSSPKRTSPLRSLALVGLAVAISIGTAFTVGFRAGQGTLVQFAPTVEEGSSLRLSLLEEVWAILQKEFYNRSALDPQRVTEGAIKGALETLDDPYTFYATPSQAAIEEQDLQGSFSGIGVEVAMREGKLLVAAPREGSPGAQAGLQPGDQIVAVDGRPTEGMSLIDAVAAIRGPEGTTVALIIRREGVADFEVKIVRGIIQGKLVERRALPGGIGYIRLTVFGDVSQEFESELRAALRESPNGLILDLRYNTGGYLDVAVDIASQFISEGIIVYQRRGDGSEEAISAKPGGLATRIPLVVLVNHGSASASEILAGALRDHGRAILIGQKTFGKGTVQHLYDLGDGSQLRLTVAHWLTPNRDEIEGQGLTPDIAVETPSSPSPQAPDPQLQRAIEYLTTPR